MKTTLRAMTLVEVVVAIAIMLIAMEGFTLLFLRSWDTNKYILESGMAVTTASRVNNKIISELRRVRQADNGDYAIESGSDFDLIVYLDIDHDGVTERVHYFLDQATDQLKKGVTEPSNTVPISYSPTDDTVTVLTNYVVNDDTMPLFTYYNKDYPGDIINNPLPFPLSVDQVYLIRVHLYVNINPVHAPDNINIESFVNLRNLNNT
ncbi:MAG: type IV pilus modification PilV family protein [Minisyncoccota bacterium]